MGAIDVPPADHGFALFGPDFGVPPGGFCVSVFLFVRRGQDLLVGRMDRDQADRWSQAWQPNLSYYEGERRAALFDGLRLPATYLREGEHPADAAGRVWTEQLGYDEGRLLGAPMILSEAGPSRRAPSYKHWDLLFLYQVEAQALPEPVPDHWAELGFHRTGELAPEDLVMLHGELLAHLERGAGG